MTRQTSKKIIRQSFANDNNIKNKERERKREREREKKKRTYKRPLTKNKKC